MVHTLAPAVPAGQISDGPQPELPIDDELVLRPWRDEDAPAIVEAFSDPDIQRWHARRCDDLSVALAWLDEVRSAWRDERSASWAVVEQATGAVLGRAAVHLWPAEGRGEMAYWLLPAGRGRGVATRATVRVTAWAHDVGIRRVELQHSVDNPASGRVARRAGFTAEGVRRGAVQHQDGWHDMATYAHLIGD
ncbi:MAG: GNAT family N-acetyltransferase [Actinomycetota bacterium]